MCILLRISFNSQLPFLTFTFRYRITIGHQTCIFDKENDPTILRAPSAGKLLQYTVEDGGHVFSGQSYAEIEVMKMVMSLNVTESGWYVRKRRKQYIIACYSTTLMQ